MADAKRGLKALTLRLANIQLAATYGAEIAALKLEWDSLVDHYRTFNPPNSDNELTQGAVIGTVNDCVGGHATVICAAGSLPGDLLRLWRPEDNKAYHLEYGFSCMGYEIPAGIGVKLAEPSRRVVVMIGDGTYLMMNSEIVTAVAENLDFTIVLLDNRAYGSIRGLQMACGSPSFNNELRKRDGKRTDGARLQINFAQHAASMGAIATKISSLEELATALHTAEQNGGVHLIVVPVSLRERVPGFESWWDVPIAEISEQEGVQVARAEYEKAAQKQIAYFPNSEVTP